MTKARDVLDQIEAHYAPNTPSSWALSNHLRGGKIDSGVPTVHPHDGFNSPMNYEEAIPLVLYFNDASVLIVTMDRVFCANEEV